MFFSGLKEPITILTDEPLGEGATELKRQVEEARFFELPPEVGEVPCGAMDYRRYTVEDGERSHTARVADPIEDPGIQALVDHPDAKALRRRSQTHADGEMG